MSGLDTAHRKFSNNLGQVSVSINFYLINENKQVNNQQRKYNN